MSKPKYQIGDRINGWTITSIFRYDWFDDWIYSLVKSVGNGNMGISCDEANLRDILINTRTR